MEDKAKGRMKDAEGRAQQRKGQASEEAARRATAKEAREAEAHQWVVWAPTLSGR